MQDLRPVEVADLFGSGPVLPVLAALRGAILPMRPAFRGGGARGSAEHKPPDDRARWVQSADPSWEA